MEILITVLITTIIIFLIELLLFKISTPYLRKIINEAINVSNYINTYHYMDSEWDRIELRKKYFL